MDLYNISINNKVENLELFARKAVEGFIIGLHRSPFHGFSVEFAEHRLYNPGDNLKHVDWKVYGRTNRLFSKKYEEETNLRCCIVLDTSKSMLYQNRNGKSKLQSSIEAAAVLIEFLKRQMDASSLALFDDKLYQLTKSGTSSAHQRSLFAQLEHLYDRKTNAANESHISNVLHELSERLHRRSLVILFSDMLEEPADTVKLLGALQHLSYNKHEVIIFMVGDREKEWLFEIPNQPVTIEDSETGERVELMPEQIRKHYLDQVDYFIKEISEYCLSIKAGFHLFDINQNPTDILKEYLIKRKKLM